MQKKILVTGGAGFIGSNLVRHLLSETGYHVVNVDKLTYAGNPNSLRDVAESERYHFEEVDLCDAPAIASLFEKHHPVAVMHLAAESHVDRSIDGPGEFIQTNVIGTFNLLQASLAYWQNLPAAGDEGLMISDSGENPSAVSDQQSQITHAKNFRFLHVSTDEVFGSLGPSDPAFSETTPYDPHSPYSASKAASDHLARAWQDTYGLPVLVTNCSNNYGPYQFPEKLIPVVILKCLRGEPIPVYGKGENIRDWLYVEDHCRALHTVLEKGTPGETYTIGGNNERQNIELVKMLCSLMDEFMQSPDYKFLISDSEPDAPHQESRIENQKSHKSYQKLITFVTDRPGHDLRYAIDASKIRDELGWEPQEDFDSGFRKTVKWYLENRDWWENILSGDYKLERLGKSSR